MSLPAIVARARVFGAFVLAALAVSALAGCASGDRESGAPDDRHGDGPVAGSLAMADGLEVAFTVYGEGADTLVLIHGWAGDQTLWTGQIDTFASRYTVLTLDLPGHGQSGKQGRAAWTIDQLGRDVAALLRGRGIGRATLVGHDLGAEVALVAAREAPELVEAVVTVDAPAAAASADESRRRRGLLGRLRQNFREACRSHLRGLFAAATEEGLVNRSADAMCAGIDPAAGVALLDDQSRGGGGAARRAVRQPVRAIESVADPAEPAPDPDTVPETPKIEKTGHYPMLEEPGEFNRRLGVILMQLEPAPAP